MAQSLQFHTNLSHPALFPLSSSHRLSPFQIPYCRRNRPLGYLQSSPPAKLSGARCCSEKPIGLRSLKTCKFCKTQFDPSANHPRACRFHTAHFAGETKRKFESVYTGGTMNTPNSGQVLEYWHCCGSEDPFDPGCTASPHTSYDD